MRKRKWKEKTKRPLTGIEVPRGLSKLDNGFIIHHNEGRGWRAGLNPVLPEAEDLFAHMVSATELIDKSFSLGIQKDPTAPTKSLRAQELDWIVGILGVDQSCWVDLDLARGKKGGS